jgi:hypothetical protein
VLDILVYERTRIVNLVTVGESLLALVHLQRLFSSVSYKLGVFTKVLEIHTINISSHAHSLVGSLAQYVFQLW